jgi:Na+-translocating ferredoxin:NAD+ oxidoreductase RnfC subunit
MNISLEQIAEAGVVGMGGAGFPTWKKLQARVDTLLVNAAECEPILRKDNGVLQTRAAEVVLGATLAAGLVGANTLKIGIKGKNKLSLEAMRSAIAAARLEPPMEVVELGDFYPAGDEVTLVYELTGRIVPPAGIPLHVGCVVINNETALNIAEAAAGRPVTHSYLTVSGEVREPRTLRVPLGVSYRELVEYCGGTRLKQWVILDGGPMMGRILTDPETPVVKTSSGVIVLPADHPYVERELRSREVKYRIGKSVCDQCSLCTQLCPRYLLGHPLEPHQAMRHQFVREFPAHSRWGQVCCECGLCTLYACPEGLYPREACQDSKRSLAAIGDTYNGPKQVTVHPMYANRKVPTKRLLMRIGLSRFEHDAPVRDFNGGLGDLRIRLKQHIGTAAVPCVAEGDQVQAGQVLGRPPAGELGVPVHAPRAARVIAVKPEEIVLR